MTVRLVWTPLARADAKKIYVAIGRDQPESAERFFAKFREKAERLAVHPRLGERRPEIFRSARMLVEAPMSFATRRFRTRMTARCTRSKSSVSWMAGAI